MLDRSASTRVFASHRLLGAARRSRFGVPVDAPPHDPRHDALLGALELAASTLRRRTAAGWLAADALAQTGGNAERAALLLGVSGQAVRERRIRAHLAATRHFEALLEFLLAAPASRPGVGVVEGTVDSQGQDLAKAA
jgi:hypothetical protein